MTDNSILTIVARFVIPLILLVGLYIQFHGEYAPGGGFQAGVMFAAGWILYVLIYGLDAGLKVISARVMLWLACLGVLLYCLVGLAGVALGGRFLDYYPLADSPHTAQQTGIILVEFGVGVTVASVVMLFFTFFAGRKRALDQADRDTDPE